MLEDYLKQEFLLKVAISGLKLVLIFALTVIVLKFAKHLLFKWKQRLMTKHIELEQESSHDKEKRLDTLSGLLIKAIQILIIAVAILAALQTVGVSIAPLLASAGIFGLAIGFGAKNLVQDIISGFFIIFEDQIRQGDVAAINGQGGTVEQINFRTIILRDVSGSVHYFRNGSINTISNMSKGWSAMVFDIGVAYKEDINKVMKVMQEAFDELNNDSENQTLIINEFEIFGLDSFGDSALIVKARIKTRPLSQWKIGRAYRKILKEHFDRHNIEIPFPHQSIYFGEASLPFNVNLSSKEDKKD